MEFFQLDSFHLYIIIALSLINGILMCFASYKFFQMIQLTGYKLKGYFLWLKDTKAKYVSRMILLSLLSAFCVLVTSALFDVYHSDAIFSYLGLIFYFVFSIVFIKNLYSAPKKVPLKNTKRMTRLTIAMFIFVSALSFVLTAISLEYFGFVKFGIMCIVPILVPFIVPVVHAILIPLEQIIISAHASRAKRKLKLMPNLIKVGITGSFGKTSTKYILNTILRQKYKVCMSPHSFNTLTGLSKVVNNYLKQDDEILIAEMGARNIGDIKKLCKLINPKYGIITAVGNQHLYSFKTVENIFKTKNELVEYIPQDGKIVFNGNNDGATKLYESCQKPKEIVGAHKNSKIKAKNIVYDENGTTFDLVINKKEFSSHTYLVGSHNVQNILLCVELALTLGLSEEQIVKGISKLEPVPHRLELSKTPTNIILDDSYNASVEGSTVALEVLKSVGERKIVITPGLVELGEKEKQENINFGKRIAKVADIVVIVNNVNFEAIKEGLEQEKFSDENIYQVENLQKAKILIKDFIKKGDAILFENDLPDNYI